MKSKWWNPRVNAASFCIMLLLMHFVLKQVLARFDVVSCIFAAGDHLPLWMIVATATFVMVRVLVFFVVPAVVVWKAASIIGRKFLKSA